MLSSINSWVGYEDENKGVIIDKLFIRRKKTKIEKFIQGKTKGEK